MIPHNLLGNWTAAHVARVHSSIFVAPHRLSELGIFCDEGLAQTLDAHPRAELGAYTMGTDPVRRSQWREGDTGQLSGKTLLESVKRGRLTLHLRNVSAHHSDYRVLVDTLYDQLHLLCIAEEFVDRRADLRISSPTAMVYYHVDRDVVMQWQIRGTRQVWVYPLEAGVLSARTLESVVCGRKTGAIEYYPELDRYATEFDLQPDQMITWPQHTPNRSVNAGNLNVTLITHHMTREAIRKNNVCLVNRSLRRALGRRFPSARVDGLGAVMKDLTVRAVGGLRGRGPKPSPRDALAVSFQVDPNAPDAVRQFTPPAAAPTSIAAPTGDVSGRNVPLGN